MSDLHQPDPTQQLSHHAYYQLVHTICGLLPPPLADTPEALLTRNQAAIAKVAALAPVNADEADIAAHCVAARAQAEDVLRLLRRHAADIQIVMRLNAQFALMERTAVSLRNQLLRLQTARQKRETNAEAAGADEWATYIAARKLQSALDQRHPPAELQAEHAVPARSAVAQAEHAMPAPPAEPPAEHAMPALPAEPPAAVSAPAPTAQPAVPPVWEAAPSRAPIAATPPRHRRRLAAETDDLPRDLAAEADHYAIIHPRRAGPIRRFGGLPPNCDFGPPDDDLIHAIVTGTSPTLRALDGPATAAA
jgi:hypothetical protein